jgi:hypothetical protein
MDIAALTFPDEFFDHAYSVCVLSISTPDQAGIVGEMPGVGGTLHHVRLPQPAPYLTARHTRPQNQRHADRVQRSFIVAFHAIGMIFLRS